MKLFILGIAFFGCLGICSAEETLEEKTEATLNDIGRSGKKSLNRTKEALCGKLTGDNKVQCLAKKMKNRLEEGKDAIVDKASELKNAVDADTSK